MFLTEAPLLGLVRSCKVDAPAMIRSSQVQGMDNKGLRGGVEGGDEVHVVFWILGSFKEGAKNMERGSNAATAGLPSETGTHKINLQRDQ